MSQKCYGHTTLHSWEKYRQGGGRGKQRISMRKYLLDTKWVFWQ